MKLQKDSTLTAPTLHGQSIYLRPVKVSDFEAIKVFRQDPENCRYIRPPESDEQVLKIITQLSQPWKLEEGLWNGLVICLSSSDNVVGELVFRVDDWNNQRAEIGYRLSTEVAGRGICTKAATLFIQYLIKELGVYKFVARCDPRNIASFKVMEKLGFEKEAFFKDHYLNDGLWTDQLDYGLLAKNWPVST